MNSPAISRHGRLSAGLYIALVFLFLSLGGAAWAADFERTFSFDSKEMIVASMIGAVEVIQAAGDEFKITVRVQGNDAEEGLLEFHATQGSKGELEVAFPLKDHRKYVYPPMGHDAKTNIHFQNEGGEGGSWLKKVFHGISGQQITVRGHGSGLEIWADLTIEVPRGRVLHLNQGVGTIGATAMEADLDLDIHSGSIEGSDIEGDFAADTGSGSVAVRGIKGDLLVDTGSGGVTGANVQGQKVMVDTGSGGVTLKGINCVSLSVDTGSGSVDARGVTAEKASIDTGSGSVLLQLDGMGAGKFVIDTGSGGITLDLPDGASAHISADTGSGSVDTQISGAMVKIKGDDQLEMTVGDGEARVILDAGSGSITIR